MAVLNKGAPEPGVPQRAKVGGLQCGINFSFVTLSPLAAHQASHPGIYTVRLLMGLTPAPAARN